MSSPLDSGFTPRKEFIQVRSQKTTSNSFSLLAISGANLIRLYSFPNILLTALRSRLDSERLITALREDDVQNMSEITLEGKPWASGKSVKGEKLLLTVIDVIYQHGYSYLSTIDYGREQDDRIAMAFSKRVAAQTSTDGSPQIPSNSPSVRSNKPTIYRVPFALSFPSATLLRVISPPLHCTPAVLQAVRGSWPRGVVAEKKVGDACFEFRLKGYKWFQQDTFATDSLRHILTLLSALDAHSFTLLTSLSLSNNRSRVKDLWIFTSSPPTDDGPDSPAGSLLNGEFSRGTGASSPQLSAQRHPTASQHHRLATSPNPSFPQPQTQSYPPNAHVHTRAATDNTNTYSPPSSPLAPAHQNSVLRKPAPRAQIPISVIQDAEQPETIAAIPEHEQYRTNMPSVISNPDNNMTGVGASAYTPDVFYTSSPFGETTAGASTSAPVAILDTSRTSGSQKRESSVHTPPLHPSQSSSPPSSTHQPRTPDNVDETLIEPGSATQDPSHDNLKKPELLSGAFRESALSTTSTQNSYDVPIAWTGTPALEPQGENLQPPRPPNDRSSTGVLPGGWISTPQEERSEETASPVQPHEENIQDVGSRVDSPELNRADSGLRKSEAGLVGMFSIPSSTSAPPVPQLDKGKGKEAGSQGWVIIDVDAKPQDAPVPPTAFPTAESESMTTSPTLPERKVEPTTPEVSSSPESELVDEATMDPTCKAIAIIDAVDAKNKGKGRTKSNGGIRRFFSLTKKKHREDSDASLLAISEIVATSAQTSEGTVSPKTTRATGSSLKTSEKDKTI